MARGRNDRRKSSHRSCSGRHSQQPDFEVMEWSEVWTNNSLSWQNPKWAAGKKQKTTAVATAIMHPTGADLPPLCVTVPWFQQQQHLTARRRNKRDSRGKTREKRQRRSPAPQKNDTNQRGGATCGRKRFTFFLCVYRLAFSTSDHR